MGKCATKDVRGYAGGGEVKETPEQLIARMSAKYGTSGAGQGGTQGSTEPQPIVQPAPQPTPKSAASIGGIVGLLKGRQAQIDKAVNGYAQGGMISGPGTSTSDSIPAKVEQTGEPIAVSNGERILSADQDKLMQKVAQSMGYDSLDALLEQGTGKPVGPTMKGGLAQAATGVKIGAPQENLKAIAAEPTPAVVQSGVSPKPTIIAPAGSETAYTVEPGINPVAEIGRFMSDSANAARGNGTYEENRARSQTPKLSIADAPPVQKISAPSVKAAPNQVAPITGMQERAFGSNLSAPVSSPLASPVNPRTPGIQFFAAGTPEAQDIAAKINSRGFVPEPGQGLVKSSSGRAISIDSGNPLAQQPSAQAPATLDGLVQERARRALSGDLAGAHGLSGSIEAMRATAGTGQDAKLKEQTIAQNDLAARDQARISTLVDELNDPNLSPEQQRAKLQTLYAAQGRGKSEQRYLPMHNLKTYGDMGQVTGEEPGGFFDTVTGQPVGATQRVPAAKLDIKVGTPVNAPDGIHTFQGKTLTVKGGKVTGVS